MANTHSHLTLSDRIYIEQALERRMKFKDIALFIEKDPTTVSKEIRHLSYERSLSSPKKVIAEAEQLDDITDENALYSEDLMYAEDYGESAAIDQDESAELAETDFISKLGLLLNQKKAQTKYTALNINSKLTVEQRKVLERVFDLITQEYDHDVAEQFVNTIATKF